MNSSVESPRRRRPDVESLACSTVDGLADPAVALDTRLWAIHFNVAFVEFSGCRMRSLRQMLTGELSVFGVLCHSPDEDRRNAQTCLRSRRPVHIAEATVRNRQQQEFVGMQTFIPMLDASGQSVALIVAFRDLSSEARIHQRYKELMGRERQRTDELERQVQERTRMLTAALEEVTRLSETDPLTGLLNRRAFTDLAEAALRQGHRQRNRAAILMCDLDRFKLLNDTLGHQAGDAVLVAVASALKTSVQERGEAARFGGEEFIILLSRTDEQDALAAAEDLRQVVRNLSLMDLVGRAAREWRQTISVGVALYPDQGQTLEQLVSRADQALYRAKNNGRDRVERYDDRLDGSMATLGSMAPGSVGPGPCDEAAIVIDAR